MKLLLIGTLFVIGGSLYLGSRFLAPFRWARRTKSAIWAVIALHALCILWFPLAWYLPIGLEGTRFETARHWLVYGALGIFLMFGLSLVVRDVIWGALRLLDLARSRGRSSTLAILPTDPERRRFVLGLTSWGTLVSTTALIGRGFYSARGRPAVKEITVRLEHLPDAFDGYRIAQISDLHIGQTIGRPFVEQVVRSVNDLEADLVAVTGDLTDGRVAQLRGDAAPLGQLRGRDGVFFVTGNHDYYWGDAEGWVRETARLGMTPLVNEHRVIERDGAMIVLAGIPDYHGGDFIPSHAPCPEASLVGAPSGTVRILLAHQPRSVTAAESAGFDLQLSGHTHGGQLLPFHLAAMLTQPALSGLHAFGGTLLYVNSGTGYWGPPLRIAAPSEITLITLRRA